MIDNNTRFLGVDSSKVNLIEKKDSINNAVTQYYTADEIGAAAGGGLEGTQYVFVAANGTDTENAAELQAAYVTAQGMSPSATNRITVIAAPANYNFATPFVMDTQYIDLVSLDGNRSIVFNGIGTISITSNDVFVKGVDVQNKNFTIANNLFTLKVENCKGGDFSFGGTFDGTTIEVSGTFIDCEAGGYSFSCNAITYEGIASGTFINCKAGAFSFCGFVSGTFINCEGDNASFGGSMGAASGNFTNCKGGDGSFGGDGIASGTFTNCEGGDYSFAGFIFGGFADAAGTFTNCKGGDYSFGGGLGNGTASGIFKNCQGGEFSFGYFDSNGTFENCKGGQGSFGTVNSRGNYNNCTGEDVSFGGSLAEGVYVNCVGGFDSFARNGSLTGKLYYCRLTGGDFATVQPFGRVYYSVDGNGDPNNQ